MRGFARVAAAPVAAWCALAGAVSIYRVVVSGWPQALFPGIVFLGLAYTLGHFTATNRFPWRTA